MYKPPAFKARHLQKYYIKHTIGDKCILSINKQLADIQNSTLLHSILSIFIYSLTNLSKYLRCIKCNFMDIEQKPV